MHNKAVRKHRTFGQLANPKANNKMERLEASSRVYKMAVSSFSIEGNCFMKGSFPVMKKPFSAAV